MADHMTVADTADTAVAGHMIVADTVGIAVAGKVAVDRVVAHRVAVRRVLLTAQPVFLVLQRCK